MNPPKSPGLPTSTAPSTVVTRWAAPLLVVALGAGLSLWIELTLPRWTFAAATRMPALAGLPVIAVLVLVGVRLVSGRTGRTGDLVLVWLMLFLMGMHVLLLALGVGLLSSLEIAVPMATGLLFVGLGPTLASLEPGSALGIRTQATLGSAVIWRRAHKELGIAFSLAGVAAMAAAAVSRVAAMGLLFGGPAVALVVTAVRAKRSQNRNEDPASVDRPNDTA